MNGPGHPLRLWTWIVLPALTALVATVLLATPVRLFGLRLPEPVWPMVLAFAWPVIRPSLVAPFALLLLGLFVDLFWGVAIGQWSLALLATYGAALASRSLMVGQGIPALAGWYVGLTAFLFAAMHLLSVFDLRAAASVGPVGLQALATAALFPLAYKLIDVFEDAGARIR